MKLLLNNIAVALMMLFSLSSFAGEPIQVQFRGDLPAEGNLVVGVYQGGELGQYGQTIDNRSEGGLSYAIKAAQFDGKPSSTKLITAPKGSGFDQILLIGLGGKGEVKAELEWQEIGGNAAQSAINAFNVAPVLVFDVANADTAAQIAYGAKLGSYYFDKYQTDEAKRKSQSSVMVVSPYSESAEKFYQQELEPLANAVWLTRDISNEPANVIYPESFVQRWKSHFKGMANIKIRVFDEKDMQKKGMGAIYGVGRGSKRPPRMMIVEYMGGSIGSAPVVLVGKGITFDSGGISIKPWEGMWNMKFDMSGAASVMGTLHALAGRQAKVNAVAIAALAENLPSGNAQRPGDVVTSMSGKTIEVRQTDAEGRLVLADGIYYGDVTYNPALLVDVATLTGSAARALGKDYAAFFTRHDELVEPFLVMGKATGDKLWHMPLNDHHFKLMENKVADLVNLTTEGPGASTGAAFVGSFVREATPWVHLDIAGVAYDDKPLPVKASPGSAAFGVRLLNGYIKVHFEGK